MGLPYHERQVLPAVVPAHGARPLGDREPAAPGVGRDHERGPAAQPHRARTGKPALLRRPALTRLLHKLPQACVGQAAAFSTLRVCRSSPSQLSLLFIERTSFPAGRRMATAGPEAAEDATDATAATEPARATCRANPATSRRRCRGPAATAPPRCRGAVRTARSNMVSLRVRPERESKERLRDPPDDAVRLPEGSEHDPLRRAFTETVRRMAGRGRTAEPRPDPAKGSREPPAMQIP